MKSFLFDCCLGKRLPEAIAQLNPPFEVIPHFQRFVQETPDDQWLTVAGENGWIVITKDDKWHRVAAERAAVVRHKVGCFCLGGANSTSWDTAVLFMRAFDDMVSVIGSTPAPFLYLVERSGKVSRKNLAVETPDTAEVAGA